MKHKKDRSDKQELELALKKDTRSPKAATPAASADGSKSPPSSSQKESESAPGGHTVVASEP